MCHLLKSSRKLLLSSPSPCLCVDAVGGGGEAKPLRCPLPPLGRGVGGRRVSKIDAGRERFELADALLEVGHLDQLAGGAAAFRSGCAGQLEASDLEPALPAAQGREGGDA